MSAKPGRNDPCPCGSGRKYKHCCGKAEAPAAISEDSHERAVERALAWLAQYHRKAFAAALEEALDDALMEIFDDDEEAVAEAMSDLAPELFEHIQINLTEWLLAEGDIQVKGTYQRVSELLLGPRGPLLTVGQRAWLAQLAQRPLRLYDVTDVVPGTGLTLCDALDSQQPPIVVIEREGSRTLRPGLKIGARVMALDGTHQLSGAVYPFSMLAGQAVQEELRALPAYPDSDEDDDTLLFGLRLIEAWLAQHLRPGPLPDFVDARSGDPLLFTTDHYEVHDWDALGAALAAQPDVDGDRTIGWNRLVDGDDGATRSVATVTPQQGGQRVSLFYKTAGLADSGRAWFDALTGDAVKFLLREVSDPKGIVSRAREAIASAPATMGLPEGVDPNELQQAISAAIHRYYDRWADESIPALDGQTPRQALATAAGLERVKGLLRSYEDGEADMAAQQGREPISYQFLWDELGLTR